MRVIRAHSFLVLALLSAGRVQGQAFTGSTDITAPSFAPVTDLGRCGTNPPNVLLGFPVAAGTSDLGAFTAATSNCVDRSTGSFFNGLFTFDFGGGRTLFGTYLGTIALPLPLIVGVPAAISEQLTVAGGTGALAGASGSIVATGAETLNANGTFHLHLDMVGTVSAVPEPATVPLLASGLAILGIAARGRRDGARRRRRA